MKKYVHGYSSRETQRLSEQSLILEQLLHSGTEYPADSKILEPGCGVGAQTLILARKNPQSTIIALDISQSSIAKARQRIEEHGMTNVTFLLGDIQNLTFEPLSFDHIFICFVLEHIDQPLETLKKLRGLLRANGTLTAIEGDHGSCFWHPDTSESRRVWEAMITVQQQLKHDPLIGRRLYPLLRQAGFHVEKVEPRWVYTDANNPHLMDGVLNQIIVPMTQTAREAAIKSGLVSEKVWTKGIQDLAHSGVPPLGTFFYTWFKGIGVNR